MKSHYDVAGFAVGSLRQFFHCLFGTFGGHSMVRWMFGDSVLSSVIRLSCTCGKVFWNTEGFRSSDGHS